MRQKHNMDFSHSHERISKSSKLRALWKRVSDRIQAEKAGRQFHTTHSRNCTLQSYIPEDSKESDREIKECYCEHIHDKQEARDWYESLGRG